MTKDSIRGSSDRSILILTSLASCPRHGYALIKDIEEFAGVKLGAGTLYGALAKLERDGLVQALPAEERRQAVPDHRRRPGAPAGAAVGVGPHRGGRAAAHRGGLIMTRRVMNNGVMNNGVMNRRVMNRRVTRLLLALYPRAWRDRYGAEVASLTDELIRAGETTPLPAGLNLVAGAAVERARALAGSRSALAVTSAAAIVAMVGGAFVVTGGARPGSGPRGLASANCLVEPPLQVVVPAAVRLRPTAGTQPRYASRLGPAQSGLPPAGPPQSGPFQSGPPSAGLLQSAPPSAGPLQSGRHSAGLLQSAPPSAGRPPVRSAPVRSALGRSASVRSAPVRSAALGRSAPVRSALGRSAPVRSAGPGGGSGDIGPGAGARGPAARGRRPSASAAGPARPGRVHPAGRDPPGPADRAELSADVGGRPGPGAGSGSEVACSAARAGGDSCDSVTGRNSGTSAGASGLGRSGRNVNMPPLKHPLRVSRVSRVFRVSRAWAGGHWLRQATVLGLGIGLLAGTGLIATASAASAHPDAAGASSGHRPAQRCTVIVGRRHQLRVQPRSCLRRCRRRWPGATSSSSRYGVGRRRRRRCG